MKKLLNLIILLSLMYLAYLIYIGDGVVDFNVVWSELLGLWGKVVGYFMGLAG